MDYKKKYEEALERAKEIMECSKSSDSKEVRMVLSFFPELKGNMDEQMRKKCIELIKELKTFCMRDGQDECIAWLEKQGEPKEINPSEFDLRLNILLKHFEPLPKEEIASVLSFYLNVVQNNGTYKEEKKCEQKPAEWSEEDGENSKNILYILNQLKGNAIYSEDKIAEKCIDWLKSIKDRVQPQPKQEWSEEDEGKTALTIRYLDIAKNYQTSIGSDYIDGCIDWLKSLRPNHWKPSDAQMEVLVWCKPLFADPKSKDILESLIDDLNNL